MLKKIALRFIQIYQGYIRIFLPSSCRFVPSCSQYAAEAIAKYGFLGGGIRALKRLLLCHPFSGKTGDDPLV